MKRLIVFLVRKRLHLRRMQLFRFKNQRREGVYYFTDTELIKVVGGQEERSRVPLNWLLDDDCEIELVKSDG